MAFFQTLRNELREMSTEEKIGMVIDAVCTIGSGLLAQSVADTFGAGKNRFQRICMKVTMVGVGIGAREVARNALRNDYGKPIAGIVDIGKKAAKKAEEKKEEEAHE